MFTFEENSTENVYEFKISGMIEFGNEQKLKKKIEETYRGQKKTIIDFSFCDYISSTVIGLIVYFFIDKKKGKKVHVITGGRPMLRILFKSCKLEEFGMVIS